MCVYEVFYLFEYLGEMVGKKSYSDFEHKMGKSSKNSKDEKKNFQNICANCEEREKIRQ